MILRNDGNITRVRLQTRLFRFMLLDNAAMISEMGNQYGHPKIILFFHFTNFYAAANDQGTFIIFLQWQIPFNISSAIREISHAE